MECALDHIHLRCKDLEASIEFYCRVLGAVEVGRIEALGMIIVKLKLGGVIISLSPHPDGETAQAEDGSRRLGCYELGLLVADVDQAYEELKGRGAEFTRGPVQINPKVRAAFLRAPDGMQIEILQRK